MIGQIFQQLIGPVFGVIDQAVEDKDEAARIKAQIQTTVLENEATLTRSLRDIVVAEAQGESWLQRNWRPLVMVFFAIILGSYWFGFAPEYVRSTPELTDRLFDLLSIGIGGYIVGRSAEKITESYTRNRGQGNGNGQ